MAHIARQPGVRRADGHVDHAQLVFDLADHDAQLAAVAGHPVQHAGRRAHRVGAVEAHARRGAAHGQRRVAVDERQRLGRCSGRAERERLEVRRRVVVAGARDADVFVDRGLALALELQGQDVFEDRRSRRRISCSAAASAMVFWTRSPLADGASSLTEKGHSCTPSAAAPGLDLVGVVQHDRAAAHQVQVAVHGVLVERDQQVELVARGQDGLVAGRAG